MNDIDRRVLLGAAGLASVAALAGHARSGPLNPPAGPVIATGKTLPEVEPRTPLSAATTPGDASCVYRIAEPGSYYLIGNVAAPSGRSVIKIAASGVTIDLNGFTITSAGGAGSGVIAESAVHERIAVRNGHIVGMATGVSLLGNPGLRIEDLMVDTSTVDGIAVGLHATVTRCRVTRSSRYGFHYGNGAIFTDCIARTNGTGTSGAGFRASGISSIPIGGVTFNNCLAEGNLGTGIHAFGPATAENCIAINNITFGFSLSQGPTVARACIAQFNGGTGFQASGGLIEDCESSDNTGAGFHTGGCRVRGCSALRNGGIGIEFTSVAQIQHNRLYCPSAVAAIRGGGGGCRIEGNFVLGGVIGIHVTSNPGNIVIGNTVSMATTPFSLPAGTAYGAIIDLTAHGSAAVNGPSAPSAIGTPDPFANIVT